MKHTGIIRRFDDLGRIVIPKELRMKMRTHEGDAFEISVEECDGEQCYVLRKYMPLDSYMDSLREFTFAFHKVFPKHELCIVANIDEAISPNSKTFSDEEKLLISQTVKAQVTLPDIHKAVVPLVVKGKVEGCLVVLGKDSEGEGEDDVRAVLTARVIAEHFAQLIQNAY